MALFLQITLAVVLVALCAYLIPLLVQLKRTAAAVEALADSARKDLSLISGDINHLRIRADELADLAAAGMELPATLNGILAGLGRSLEGILGKGASSSLMEVLMMGLKLAFSWFTRSREAAPSGEQA